MACFAKRRHGRSVFGRFDADAAVKLDSWIPCGSAIGFRGACPVRSVRDSRLSVVRGRTAPVTRPFGHRMHTRPRGSSLPRARPRDPVLQDRHGAFLCARSLAGSTRRQERRCGGALRKFPRTCVPDASFFIKASCLLQHDFVMPSGRHFY